MLSTTGVNSRNALSVVVFQNAIYILPILKAKEFIRRYLLHILPRGFMKIHYYGFLAHANQKVSIPLLRQLINPNAEVAEKLTETVKEMMLRLTGVDVSLCRECGKGTMVYIADLPNLLLDTS